MSERVFAREEVEMIKRGDEGGLEAIALC